MTLKGVQWGLTEMNSQQVFLWHNFLTNCATRKLANGSFNAYQNGLGRNTCGLVGFPRTGSLGFNPRRSFKNEQRGLIYFFCLEFGGVPGVPGFVEGDCYGYLMKFELGLLVGDGLSIEELRKIHKIQAL